MPHYRRTITRLALLGVALGLSPLIHAQSSRPAVGDHRTWYLAEGATNSFFQEEILIANPNSGAAAVQVAFLKSDGAEVVVPVTIPAFTRHTMRVNTIPGLENANASAMITSDVDILVERSMYWPGPARRGGHNAVGVPSPATKWYFAEGSLGFFQTFFLIANPGDTAAAVKVTYLRSSDGPLEQTVTVPPRSRHTINVGAEQPEAGAFSAIIESTNGVPVIAERAMYWNEFEGGHDAVGVTEPAKSWRFPEGFTGSGFRTYLLIANPNALPNAVKVVVFFDDGSSPMTLPFLMAPQSRKTITANDYEQLQDRAFSIYVESIVNLPIVAERAIYFDNMQEGISTAGITADSTKVGFAEGQEGVFDGIGYETFYLLANASDSAAEIKATFYLENGTGIVRTFTVNPRSRFTLSGKAYGELNNQRFAAFFESANGVAFSAERAVYWGENRYGGHGSAGGAWTGNVAEPPSAGPAPPPPPPPPPAYRTPDPPAGQLLPVPDMSDIVDQMAAQYPAALRNSCQEAGGSWEFLDLVVDRLRQFDTRWGYNCKRGNCPDLSQDVVAYHAGAGPEVNGALETRTVDIINSHCGSNPSPSWNLHPYGTGSDAARWHNRNRF